MPLYAAAILGAFSLGAANQSPIKPRLEHPQNTVEFEEITIASTSYIICDGRFAWLGVLVRQARHDCRASCDLCRQERASDHVFPTLGIILCSFSRAGGDECAAEPERGTGLPRDRHVGGVASHGTSPSCCRTPPVLLPALILVVRASLLPVDMLKWPPPSKDKSAVENKRLFSPSPDDLVRPPFPLTAPSY